MFSATLLSSKIVKNAILKVYPGYDHGMYQTHKNETFRENSIFMPENSGALEGREAANCLDLARTVKDYYFSGIGYLFLA